MNLVKKCFLVYLTIFYFPNETTAQTVLEGLYCGAENCYDVLGVTRDSSRNEIAKQYRKLAKKHHPDLHRDENDKKNAEEMFKKIANAYEILKDDESRNDYDYMLDHPEEVYSHYYRYYRRRVAPKVDVRIVVAVTITIISAVQYFGSWQRYDSAMKYLLTVPKYRNKAVDVAREHGLIDYKKQKGKPKNEIKEETDAILRKVLEDNMDIRGGYAKPKITDILWIQIIKLPYIIVAYVAWFVKWHWKFSICKEPYGEEEKYYLIRKLMKLGEHQFEAIEEFEKKQFLTQELWKPDKFEVWQKKKEEDMKKQMAESAKYKAFRRYLKNHGPSRMTFDDS
uniref:J domain-containing protein n=1 Tax=Clastoptera arizonana TaxID=38151 RepID=A0A1B6CRA4_9HEMI